MKPPFFDNHYGLTITGVQSIVDYAVGIDQKDQRLLSLLIVNAPDRNTLVPLQELVATMDMQVPAIRARLASLSKAGIVEHTKIKIPRSKRPVSLFRVKAPDLTQPPRVKKTGFNHAVQTVPGDQQLEDAGAGIWEAMAHSENNFLIDSIFCTTLFTALPSSRRLVKEPLDVVVDWYGLKVAITLRPEADKALAKLDDIKYWIAMLTTLVESVQREGVPFTTAESGQWVVRVSTLLNCLGMPTSGGHSDMVEAAMDRLASTTIEIRDIPQKVMEKSGFDHAEQRFEPLSNLGIYHQRVDKHHRKYVTFTLPPQVHQAVIAHGKSTFPLSPNALHFNDSYLLKIHLWAKRRLGKSLNHKFVGHTTAWREISPGLSFPEHARRLKDSFTKFAGYVETSITEGAMTTNQGKGLLITAPYLDSQNESAKIAFRVTANIFGYILRITAEGIHVTRDPSDEYTGGRSPRALSNDHTGKEKT